MKRRAARARPIEVDLPEPQKERLRRLAEQQGMTMSALLRRIFYMYGADPVRFESCYAEAKTLPPAGREAEQ